MRTIATLNLPSSTSGICVPAAAPAAQPVADAAASDAAGLEAAREHPPSTSDPTVSNARTRPVRPTIDSSSFAGRGIGHAGPRDNAPPPVVVAGRHHRLHRRRRSRARVALGMPLRLRSHRRSLRTARPAALGLPSRRCSNGPSCPRGRASSPPGSRARDRSPSPRTCWPGRASSRPRRPASPTSWSTSRSRARPATRRAARSARRSRASAARSTPRRTASRPSTGSASRGARRPGRWTSSAS